MSAVESLAVTALIIETVALVAASLVIVYTTVRYRERLMYPRATYLLGTGTLLITVGGLLQSAVHQAGVGLPVLITIGHSVVTLGIVAFAYATYLLSRDVLHLEREESQFVTVAESHDGGGFGVEVDE